MTEHVSLPTVEELQAHDLFRTNAFIAGSWVEAKDGKRFDVIDPATGNVIAAVASCAVDDVDHAISSASDAWAEWRDRTGKERAQLLRKWFDLMVANERILAGLMSLEQGKSFAESSTEVAYGASFIEWFGEEAKRMDGSIVPGHRRDARILVLRQPVGVVAAITPWNFPIAMITRKAGPALAAGCPIVIKPASATPLCALALARLAEQAGIPPGILSVVPSRQTGAVGTALTTSPLVRKVSFTGSTEIGKILLKQAADTVKKVSMELGGNAPVIVFDDADIDKAVAGTIAAKYRNSGQTCVCANRVLVQDGIYDRFVEALKKATEKLTVGPALSGTFDQGPLIDMKAVEKVEELIQDATDLGASVATGGTRDALGETFFRPTVLRDVPKTARIAKEEVFGPVAPIFRFADEREAIEMANDTEFGLASYLFTQDLSRAIRVAEAIESGMVGINSGMISTEVAPFGGVKESGLGREGSSYGLEDYTELKYLSVAI